MIKKTDVNRGPGPDWPAWTRVDFVFENSIPGSTTRVMVIPTEICDVMGVL